MDSLLNIPVEVAFKVYPVPILLILKPVKVATPFTALTVAVPAKVPLPGFVSIASVIGAVLVFTRLSY